MCYRVEVHVDCADGVERLPTPFSLTCEAVPHVDKPADGEFHPFLAWSDDMTYAM